MMLDRLADIRRRFAPRAGTILGRGIGHAALRMRQLGARDLPAVERHLVALGPSDRRARFLGTPADGEIAGYVRQLNPSDVALIGAFDDRECMVGLAEAHPINPPGTVEVAVSVDPPFRRRGHGRRLVARALALASGRGARSATFVFDPQNHALANLVQALGGTIASPGLAALDCAAQGVKNAACA
jgi:ribosomal protein S18 acetylase RimI-like enzyme